MTNSHSAVPAIVTVIGDSLPLPRQHQGVEFYQTYPYLLAQWLREQGSPAEVWENAEGGVPIARLLKLYGEYHTYVGRHQQGIGIAHLGVVDCSPRPVPLSVRRIIGRLPGVLRSPMVRFLHRYRVQLLRYGPGFLFTRPKEFRRSYRKLLDRMAEDFGQICAVNITPPGPYFESRSPGVGRKIEEYNRIIAEVVQSVERVTLVDVWEACQQPDALERYVSGHDGHHLSVAGHHRLFEMIVDGRTAQEVLGGSTIAGAAGSPKP